MVDWLKEDYGVGRGHAMALFGVLKNGAVAPEKHVGSTGVHRDASADPPARRDRRPQLIAPSDQRLAVACSSRQLCCGS